MGKGVAEVHASVELVVWWVVCVPPAHVHVVCLCVRVCHAGHLGGVLDVVCARCQVCW